MTLAATDGQARGLVPRRTASQGLFRLADLQRRYPVGQVAALVALFVYGWASIDGFVARTSIYSQLVLASFLGLAALGQTLVVLLGGIDFSVPAFILFGETVILELNGTDHWPFGVALLVALLVALAAGGAIGYVCHRFKIEALIPTLGLGAVITGVVQVWTKGYLTGAPPGWLQSFASPTGRILGVSFPPVVVVWLIVAIVVGVVLRRTLMGRRLYATAANIRGATLALVSTGRFWIAAFAISAMFATLVGILLAGFAGGDMTAGNPYLFESLAAVIVGGTAFRGAGDYWRTVIGALLLTLLTTILIGRGLSEAGQEALFGAIIFVIVAAYGREPRLRDRV